MEERGVQDPFEFEDRMAHSAGQTSEQAARTPDDAGTDDASESTRPQSTATPDTGTNTRDTVGNTRNTAANTRDTAANTRETAANTRDTVGNAEDAAGEDDPEFEAELQAMIEHDLAILEQDWAEREALREMERHSGQHCPFCDMMGKKSETPGFIGGIFDDEGNRVDPATIPTPGMCILCRTYDTDNWGEEILCMLSRYDAMLDDEEFRCSGFSPKFGGQLP